MEHLPEKIAANETEARSPMTPPIEPDGRGFTASSVLCMSTSSDWPGSSLHSNLYALEDYSSRRSLMSLADSTPPLASPYCMSDERHIVEELTVRNYGSSNSYVVGCSSNKEEINETARCLNPLAGNRPKSGIGDEDLMSVDKDFLTLSSRDDLKRTPSIVGAKTSSSKQINVGFSRTSTHLTGGHINIISSSREPYPQSKILSSSGFSQFFLGKSLKASRKSVSDENPGASAELCSNQMEQNINKEVTTNEEAYATLINRNSLCSQLGSHESVRERLELPYSGINLREWLVSRASEVSKIDKLRFFRQIVQIVDIEHAQGIALMELRPSSFILLSTGDVKYIGPLIKVTSLEIIKRDLEHEFYAREYFGEKKQKLGEGKMLIRPETHSVSRFVHDSANKTVDAQLENKWYYFPVRLKPRDLLPSNIYCLGLFLFEFGTDADCFYQFLCHFESMEVHSAAMMELQHLILPPRFLSENPKEAGFCFWLLHPEPSSRPTTREILQSEFMHGSDDTSLSLEDNVNNADTDVLLDFLFSLKENKQNKASKLLESIKLLDIDIKEVERRHASGKSNQKDDQCMNIPHNSVSRAPELRDKLLKNINQLEDAYFSMRSHVQTTEISDMDRSDKDMLRNRDKWTYVQTEQNSPTMQGKSIDRVGTFFDGICKFARYNKFEVCGTLRNGDILNSSNVICSLSFDREEDYIATAGSSKKIKIFELSSLLNESLDVQYPVLEMSNDSKFSCICWNKYIKNCLASTDYDGLVQLWDANTGQVFVQYKEHQKRAWSVDFSRVDPTNFASGSDDCSVRLWSINEKNSVCTTWCPANVCCVQYSAYSSHLLAFGSADYRIYCYDLRNTKIPWCTLAGHEKAVSYVKFLDSETLISASTDNTLKLWDLNKTCLDGLSSNACSLTFRGHTNEKNFVGLATMDGYIACGSETNEVYTYYRSLPMPITAHKFGYIDPTTGHGTSSDSNGHFVSSVCWRRKSEMLAAANSNGSITILRMV
ncbi:hypothetical protein RD792_010712 [Penstemon davidsonii]|uniref:Protein kinase domain-containing protein n=1 Tax=Penstemon davidsonii TaxID=160366 RepID=A0ABR0D2W3_9LAMI|nr:hypothetical protein RD792_010712 [Penstemon davidsonii]